MLNQLSKHTLNSSEGNHTEDILSVPELAKLLDIAIPTVYSLIHFRKIPFYKPTGKRVYFRKSEIEAFVFSNRISPQNEIETAAATKVLEGSK